MKIAILGTRGIPNNYGGFEQFTEHLSVGLAKMHHDVTVYNSHNHPNKQQNWHGVEIVHCYDPEFRLGTAGQFIYDLNCIRNTRKRYFDVILSLGYSSSSVWGWLYPKKSVIISHMDGFEWKRTKYPAFVRRFLVYAERMAVRFSDFYISDSIAIQYYLRENYGINSKYISYGADIFTHENENLLNCYGLQKQNYYMLMARMEPENNIEMILQGFHNSHSQKKFLVVGGTNNKFGKYILNKFKNDHRIQFIGALYDPEKTHVLRLFSYLYFHGHSVGGTNPSLLEAMASRALIAAHDNDFNRTILNEDDFYFSSANDVQHLIETIKRGEKERVMICRNFRKVQKDYNWESIIEQYANFIMECYKRSST